jgi:hypothetical protein
MPTAEDVNSRIERELVRIGSATGRSMLMAFRSPFFWPS